MVSQKIAKNWVGNQADLPTLLFGRGPVRTFFQSSSSVTYVDVDTVCLDEKKKRLGKSQKAAFIQYSNHEIIL
jgi:hypothetical protein